jgi:cytoskeletal protein CcmA (bactofilin family)
MRGPGAFHSVQNSEASLARWTASSIGGDESRASTPHPAPPLNSPRHMTSADDTPVACSLGSYLGSVRSHGDESAHRHGRRNRLISIGGHVGLFGNKTKDSIEEFEHMRSALKKAERVSENVTPAPNANAGQESKPMSNITTSNMPSTPVAVPSSNIATRPTPGATKPGPATPEGCSSIVSTGSIWNGNLMIEGSVRIDGHLSGEIEARDTVYISEGAEVDAKVRASYIMIAGQFKGEVHCSERLEIMPTGRVKGELTTKSLVVHEGAFTDGTITMADSKATANSNRPAQSERPSNGAPQTNGSSKAPEAAASPSQPAPATKSA